MGTWRGLRSMNHPRMMHSSCFLANFVYVFGGIRNNAQDGMLKSIERIEVGKRVLSSKWYIVSTSLPPLKLPIVAPIDQTKIIIMGGSDPKGANQEAFTYNTNKK